VTDVLFGKVNPAGRLPHTVYASEAQVPPLDEYDVTKGFTYMYLNGEPLFPFGHGLSYTTFKYSDLKLSSPSIKADETIKVTVEIENSGARPGDEVVQLYIRELAPKVKRPAKELRGFQRITLQPKEKRTVTFNLPAAKLAYYDEASHGFIVNPGAFDIMAASSSADIRATTKLEVAH
jgi:beta-glucosidase